MRLVNRYPGNYKPQRYSVTSSWMQDKGERKFQEDAYGEEKGECFVLADGVGGMPHGEIASKVVVETALWAYRSSKLKPYCWKDRRLLLKRMFRASHLALLAKTRELVSPVPIATTMLVLIIGELKIHLGYVGDTMAYRMHDRAIDLVTEPDRQSPSQLTKALGIPDSDSTPHCQVFDIEKDQSFLLLTDGVYDWVRREDIADVSTSEPEIQTFFSSLFARAKAQGSTDNKTLGLIRVTSTR